MIDHILVTNLIKKMWLILLFFIIITNIAASMIQTIIQL
jgi:hypothetical protein